MGSENTIVCDAYRAVRTDIKKHTGGNALRHKPTSYGVALKWLINGRRYTYERFAREFNGTTAQNLNNIINRTGKGGYSVDDIRKMCEILQITTEYFYELSNEIEKILNRESVSNERAGR